MSPHNPYHSYKDLPQELGSLLEFYVAMLEVHFELQSEYESNADCLVHCLKMHVCPLYVYWVAKKHHNHHPASFLVQYENMMEEI